jgi:hypothetical protein
MQHTRTRERGPSQLNCPLRMRIADGARKGGGWICKGSSRREADDETVQIVEFGDIKDAWLRSDAFLHKHCSLIIVSDSCYSGAWAAACQDFYAAEGHYIKLEKKQAGEAEAVEQSPQQAQTAPEHEELTATFDPLTTSSFLALSSRHRVLRTRWHATRLLRGGGWVLRSRCSSKSLRLRWFPASSSLSGRRR